MSGLGRHKEALECYQQAADVRPWEYRDYPSLVEIYIQLGMLNEAEDMAKKLFEALKKRGRSTKFATYILNRVEEKKSTEAKPEADRETDENMTKVLAHFGKDAILRFLDMVEKREKEHQRIVRRSTRSSNVTSAPEEGFLYVLRRWNSYTPIVESRESKGGGYFLCIGGKGIAVDPGFDFVRNYFQESFCLPDIDCIFITHAHLDHMADLETLFTLLHEANEQRKGDKQRVDVYLNLGCMKKIAGWLDLRERYIGRVHVLHQGVKVDITDKLSVLPTRAKHNEIVDETYCLGLVFDAGEYRVGFTGDTGWEEDGSIGEPFSGCRTLVVHIGSIYPQEFGNAERLHRNHLGILGTGAIIGKAKPEICVVSEFGEELVELRAEITEGLTQALGLRCIAADIGTEVAFTSPPTVRCVLCGKFTDSPRVELKDSQILYVCNGCHDRSDFSNRMRDYRPEDRRRNWGRRSADGRSELPPA